ncbi:MAG: VanZ family protein [Gammaproteobacteria bacterium]|nr:VanZ family protein [Gammaproteobacteria bacterium]
MLPLQYAPRWRSASIVLLLVVLLAAISPAVWFWPDRVRILSWLATFDKWAHAATFALLAVWFAGQYRPRSYWRIAIGLVGYGLLIEICQRMVGYRTAEWLDIAADATGIIIGLAIATAGIGGWSLRFESWLIRKRA